MTPTRAACWGATRGFERLWSVLLSVGRQIGLIAVVSLGCSACALSGYDALDATRGDGDARDGDTSSDEPGDNDLADGGNVGRPDAGAEPDGATAPCADGEPGCVCAVDGTCVVEPGCEGDDCPPPDGEPDCAGERGGPASVDNCGVCDAEVDNDDSTCTQDCLGQWAGAAYPDDCGTCDADPGNDNSTCVQDCAGAWGGMATVDLCGVCDADPANDCACVPNGLACTAMDDLSYCAPDGSVVPRPTTCVPSDLVCTGGEPVPLCTGGLGDPGCSCSALACVANHSCEQGLCLPAGLGSWHFDGDATDSSGNGYDGVLQGGAVIASGGGYTYASFGGVSERVNLSAVGDALFATLDSFTLHMRVRPITYPGSAYSIFFMLGGTGENLAGNQIRLQEDAGALTLKTETGNGVDHVINLGAAPDLGVWTTLTLVVNGDQLTFYRNGGCTDATQFVPVETTAREVSVGGWHDDTYDFSMDGDIDDLRLFAWPLSRSEVQSLIRP